MQLANRSVYDRYVVADLDDTRFVESLFDRLPDVVFSVKDTQGRYIAMSGACVPRCSLRDKRDAIGKSAHDLFPDHMADRYSEQDEVVFHSGRPVIDKLDLTVFNDKRTGWCLTHKQSVYDKQGKLLGLICISKDLTELTREGLLNERFAQTVDFIQANYQRQLSLQELAEVAELSVAQLDRRMKRVFQVSTGEFVRQTRLDAAIHAMVSSQRALADIAVECGFFDQSAFHRQCRLSIGMSPRALRMQARG